ARIWRGHKAKGSMMAMAFKFMSENGKHTSKDYSWIKSTLDYSHSDETKMKISNASKGKPQSEETKIKRAIANTGKVRTEETKAKISAAQKGKPRKSQSKTSNAKRSAALKGKPRSEEFKRKMSIIAKNRSAEAKAN